MTEEPTMPNELRASVRNAIGASLLTEPGRDLEQATDEVMAVIGRFYTRPALSHAGGDLVETGRALVAALDQMIEDTKPVFAEMQLARGCPYKGKQIGLELEAFRAAIQASLSCLPGQVDAVAIRKQALEEAAMRADAAAANVMLDMLVERYGREASSYASDVLEAFAAELRALSTQKEDQK